MEQIRFSPLGEAALVMEFGTTIELETNQLILLWKETIERALLPGVIEVVPAYTTLTIFFAPESISTTVNPYHQLKEWISQLHPHSATLQDQQEIKEIPVCYEAPYALDLDFVAEANGLSAEEVIRLHTNQDYPVYFLGFSPGFPFLGGMSGQIATPRHPSPRLQIPAGSVGIAGEQTGIYPLTSPGGWQIIGRTPYTLFDPSKQPPTLLQPGDTIRFKAISKEEFEMLEARK